MGGVYENGAMTFTQPYHMKLSAEDAFADIEKTGKGKLPLHLRKVLWKQIVVHGSVCVYAHNMYPPKNNFEDQLYQLYAGKEMIRMN